MFIKKLTLENIKLCSLFFILNIFYLMIIVMDCCIKQK